MMIKRYNGDVFSLHQMDYSEKFGQAVAVIGTQWGDEGKGKLIDLLSEEYEIIVRANGGANAGHTVYVPDSDSQLQKFIFHLIPSGILHPGKVCIIGNGCVLHLPTLFEELRLLNDRHINTAGRLFISDRVHLLFDYHKEIDGLQESNRGNLKIGTTKRGIGPCYMDKVARFGIRACELLDFPRFARHFRDNVNILKKLYGAFDYSVEQEIEKYRDYAKMIQPMIQDTALYLHRALRDRKRILFEGANGFHLDIDHGTYPFVTSSNTGVSGIISGSGVPPKTFHSIIGVMKAYVSRVGEGPFPTELKDAMGEHLREVGGEYGATTNRPRRCGWFDVPLARYAIKMNGITSLNFTKLDVLCGMDVIKIGVRYFYRGKELEFFPTYLDSAEDFEVEYVEVEGWKEDISNIDTFHALPDNCKRYIQKIENLVECPIEFIGIGRERSKMIMRF